MRGERARRLVGESFSVVEWRESGEVFEIASHETLRGEVELLRNLFDAHVGVAQERFDFHHHHD